MDRIGAFLSTWLRGDVARTIGTPHSALLEGVLVRGAGRITLQEFRIYEQRSGSQIPQWINGVLEVELEPVTS
jgi:hypothetical protein